MREKFNRRGVAFGMTVTREKTKEMMCCPREEKQPLNMKIEGQDIEDVEEFKFAGSTITKDGEVKREMQLRVQAAVGELRRKVFGDKGVRWNLMVETRWAKQMIARGL
jgi:hypothetical protein